MPSASGSVRRYHNEIRLVLLRKRYHAVDIGRLDGNALSASAAMPPLPGRTRYGQPWGFFQCMDDGVLTAAAADNKTFIYCSSV